MPFASLSPREKDAFFGLLDEYFQSRPEIFSGLGGGAQPNAYSSSSSAPSAPPPPAPAYRGDGTPGSLMKHAMASNPEATVKVFSAGLRHAAKSASPPPSRANAGQYDDSQHSNNNSNDLATSVAGRIASFRSGSHASSAPAATPGSPSGLVSSRKFGTLDTTSAGGFLSSMVKKTPPPAAPQGQLPLAMPRQNSFAPPPSRRAFTAAATPAHDDEEAAAAPSASAGPPPPPPVARKPFAQKEEKGEWAEALYDYESAEAGDLNIKEGQRVLVTERSSDDWWTGEVNGKSGLFPASYVKIV